MHQLTFIIWLLLVASALGGNDFINNEGWRDDFRQKAYNTAISWEAVVAKSPAFNPELDDLPLSPRKAIESARRMLAELVPTARDWKFTQLTLEAVDDPNVLDNPKRTGYFIVCFHPADAEMKVGALSDARIIVLLTGEALRPEPEKYVWPNIIGIILENKEDAKKPEEKKP